MTRRISRIAFAAAALVAACADALPAQSRQTVGSATLVPPPGWGRAATEAGTVVYAPEEDPSAAALHVLPGEELRGDFAAWFDDRWLAFLADYLPAAVPDPLEGQSEQGLRARIALASLRTSTGGAFLVRLFAATTGTRAQALVMTYRDEAALGRYAEAAEQVFESMRILPQDRQPAPRIVDWAALIPAHVTVRTPPRGDAGSGPAWKETLRGIGVDPDEGPEGRRARLTSPKRLLESRWILATYLTPGSGSVGVRITRKALALYSSGTYEYEGDGVKEQGAFEVRGDRLVLRSSAGRSRSYTWRFDGDPEMRAQPEVYGRCPSAPDCYSLLYLRDGSGAEEVWRADTR